MTGTADEATAALADWIGTVLPDVKVSTHSLGDKQRQPGVDLRLMRAAPRLGPRTALPPLIADLDYLATVQLADAAAEQKALGELLFAVMDRRDVEVVADVDVLAACAALGIAPGPGLVLRTPLVRERAVTPVRRVRAPLVVHTSDLGIIAGQVLGPKDMPVAGASVSAAAINRFTRTDRNGRFQIGAAPVEGDVRLVARAKGAEIEGVAVAGQPITLRLPLEV